MEKVPNEVFTPKNCKHCGIQVEPVTFGEINDMHGYKLRCPHCKRVVGWGGKRQVVKTENGERTRSSQWSAKRLNKDFCEMCQRPKDFLGHGERLEVHHVTEIDQGGEDVPENIWVLCTPCHRLVHHQRTYLHQHVRNAMEAYNAMIRFQDQYPELYKRVRGFYPWEKEKANEQN